MTGRPGADLVVVGAGPIGLATAIEAALAGMSVTVLDPREPPVDKACGEGLMPAARTALARLGVEPDGVPFRGIHYLAPGRSAVAPFRTGPGLGVRRTELSRALDARASTLGVRRLAVRAGVPELYPDGVTVGGVTARWLVAADGLHSPTRRALGLDAVDAQDAADAPDAAARDAQDAPARSGRRRALRYGLRRHYRMPPWTDLVEVHWAADAEAYVTPVAPDLVGVAVLGPGGSPFDDWLRRFPALADRLCGAEAAGPVRGAGPLRQAARCRVQGRALLVGDAAGYLDALTGEGIAVGLACARALVECLVSGRPETYEKEWWRATRRYRLLTGALLAAAGRPPLRRAIVPAAQRLPWLFTGIVDQLAR